MGKLVMRWGWLIYTLCKNRGTKLPYLPARLMLLGAAWLQWAILQDPRTEVLKSYSTAYEVWLQFGGSDNDWALRVLVVCLIGTIGLIDWKRWSWYVGFFGAFSLGVLYLAVGLMFAATHPPQPGVAWLAPSMLAFWIAYKDCVQ